MLSSRRVLVATILSMISSAAIVAQVDRAEAIDSPQRVIVLGLDGLDHALVTRWIEEGALPEFAEIAKRGVFRPLTPSLPATSPVSWASLLTGTNPGQTNLFCFVRRVFEPGSGRINAALAGVKSESKPAAEWWAGDSRLRPEIESYYGTAAAAPEAVLTGTLSEMVGRTFLRDAFDAGRSVVGLRVPDAFPISREWKPSDIGDRARILSGLFTPDIAGGPGAWFIVSNDEWMPLRPTFTTTGGTKIHAVEAPGSYAASVSVLRDRELEAALRERGIQGGEFWEKARHPGTQLALEIVTHPATQSVSVRLSGTETRMKLGEWSPRIPVSFTLANGRVRRGLVEFCLSGFEILEDGSAKFTLYIPPIAIDPSDVDPLASFSHPRGYASELATAIGPFRTLGWASPTNAMKDDEIPRSVFEAGIERAFEEDRKLLEHELARNRFDLLFATFHAADHAGHLTHDESDSHALAEDRFLRATYQRLDALVGSVRQRIDEGEFGANCALVVVSDHGMAKFEREVDLNRWLMAKGYLVVRGYEETQAAPTFLAPSDGYDWSRTRAYAMGLGKIFLNLKGREPDGIVLPEQREALARQIIGELETWRDEAHGNARVVRRAYFAPDVYSGPFTDSDGDIVIGFEPPYRVSWYTTLMGVGEDSGELHPNSEAWDGDHASVDPSAVLGTCFLYRKAGKFEVAPEGSLDIRSIAPTVLDLLGVPASPAHEAKSILR